MQQKDKGPRVRKIPPGDTHERLVCPECDFIAYENPKIVNVVVATHINKNTGEEEFLLCKRAIEPVGKWTIPGGYMENGESLKKGTLREAFEEATARPKIGELIAIYQPPSKHEVIMIFRGTLRKRKAAPGIESQAVGFFKWDDIPWKELAFPFVEDALKAYKKHKGKKDFQPEIILGKKAYVPPKPENDNCCKKKPPSP